MVEKHFSDKASKFWAWQYRLEEQGL